MIICSCNVLTDNQVRDCLARMDEVPATAREIYRHLGCAPRCGRCIRNLVDLMQDAISEKCAAEGRETMLAAE